MDRLDQKQQPLRFQRPRCRRSLLPRVITRYRNTERRTTHGERVTAQIRFHKGVLHLLSLAKYAAAFFNISRSIRNHCTSCRSSESSICSGVTRSFGAPATSSPASYFTTQSLTSFGNTPKRLPTSAKLMPSSCTYLAASSLNSAVNRRRLNLSMPRLLSVDILHNHLRLSRLRKAYRIKKTLRITREASCDVSVRPTAVL